MLIAMEELVGSLEARAGQIQTNARFPNLRNKEPVLMKTDKGFLCELPAITNVQWRKHGKNSHSMNRTIIEESYTLPLTIRMGVFSQASGHTLSRLLFWTVPGGVSCGSGPGPLSDSTFSTVSVPKLRPFGNHSVQAQDRTLFTSLTAYGSCQGKENPN